MPDYQRKQENWGRNLINKNAETVRKLLKPREEKIRLYQSTPSGLQVLPSSTNFLLPALIPADLIGDVRIDTFDLQGRPLRRGVDAYLPGLGSTASESTEQTADPQAADHKPPQPAARTVSQQIDELLGHLNAASQAESAKHTPPSSQPPPPSPSPRIQLTTTPTPTPAVNPEPDLAREVTLAQVQQLRSLTQQSEAATESAIEQERLSLVQNATYTREVAEWQQLSSVVRQEQYRDAKRTQEMAQRQIEQADYASRRLLKTTMRAMRTMDMVAKRLNSKDYRVPPPPKPQVDWGMVAVEGMRMFATLATALSPGATPNPQAFAALAGLAGPAAPAAAPTVPAAAPTVPAAPAAPAINTVEEPTIVLTKERLLAFAAANTLGVVGNSETLAALVRGDRLHLTLKGIEPPVHGVYHIRKSTLIQLAADGILTLIGDSDGFRLLVESGLFEEFLRTEQGETQGTK